jgi:ribonuclease HI
MIISQEQQQYTDSRITLQSLKNTKNHNYFIEEIRKTAIALEKSNWIITFTWTKAYAGIYGNELADKLASDLVKKHANHFMQIVNSIDFEKL